MKYKTIRVIDHEATGKFWRMKRREATLSLREMSRRLKLSAPYVSDLELGRRNWSEKLEEKYQRVLDEVHTQGC